jgi:hypothetical protein
MTPRRTPAILLAVLALVGLHAFEERLLIGGGFRIVVPAVTIGDRPAQFRTRRERVALAAVPEP